MFFLLLHVLCDTVFNDMLNRCNLYNINRESCMNSQYYPRPEYDAFVNSFNLPVEKSPECNHGICKIVVYKDPPRIFIRGDHNCSLNGGKGCEIKLNPTDVFYSNRAQNYTNPPRPCSGEKCIDFRDLIKPLITPPIVATTPEKEKPLPIESKDNAKIVYITKVETITSTATSKDVETVTETKIKAKEDAKSSAIVDTKEKCPSEEIKGDGEDIYAAYPQKYINCPKIKFVNKQEIKTVTLDLKDLRPKHHKAGIENSPKARYIEDSSISKNMAPKEEVITLLRYKTITKIQEMPITLYRETITTITKEKPIINYKITTVTEEKVSTVTKDKPVTIISQATEYITTTVSKVITEIKEQTTTTVTPVYRTLIEEKDRTVTSENKVIYTTTIILPPKADIEKSSLSKKEPPSKALEPTTTIPEEPKSKENPLQNNIEALTGLISPIIDNLVKSLKLKEPEEKATIIKTETIYKTEIESVPRKEKERKTVTNTVYEYKKKPKCKIKIKEGSKFGCNQNEKIILKTIYIPNTLGPAA